jgi:hypothetical protein
VQKTAIVRQCLEGVTESVTEIEQRPYPPKPPSTSPMATRP